MNFKFILKIKNGKGRNRKPEMKSHIVEGYLHFQCRIGQSCLSSVDFKSKVWAAFS